MRRVEKTGKEDPHQLLHITKEKVLNAFDSYFSMSAIIEMMDIGLHGRKGSDGKRIDQAKEKPAFDSGKVLDWLMDHFVNGKDNEERQTANLMVAAIEKFEDEENTDEKREAARKEGEGLAKKLGWENFLTVADKDDAKKIKQFKSRAEEIAAKAREKVLKELQFDDETNEWWKDGISKMLAHKDMQIFGVR